MAATVLVICYLGFESASVRVGYDSTLRNVIDVICEKWSSLTPNGFEIKLYREGRSKVIESDWEFQSIICFAINKKEAKINFTIGIVNEKGSSSAILDEQELSSTFHRSKLYDGLNITRKPLISDKWGAILVGVGQVIEGGPEDFKNPPLTSKVVKQIILQNVREKPTMRPQEVISFFKEQLGVDLTYHLALKGRELAQKEVFGDAAKSYNLLSWYVEALKRTNPGSHVVLEVNQVTRKFERFFVAFEACVQGFNSCRPVVCLDGTTMKEDYLGVLMAATGKNANDGIFPFAIAIVSSEDLVNWDWFLKNLAMVLPSNMILTFISDRHSGLLDGVRKHFGHYFHAYCSWHLKCNLRLHLSGNNPKSTYIEKLFDHVAYANNQTTLSRAYAELVKHGGNKIKEFVDSVPFEHWVNACFGGQRYVDMCSNIAESFNAWIREERNMPATSMLDLIRLKMTKMMSDRRDESSNWTTFLCPEGEKLLLEKIHRCRTWRVTKATDYMFEVHSPHSHVVIYVI